MESITKLRKTNIVHLSDITILFLLCCWPMGISPVPLFKSGIFIYPTFGSMVDFIRKNLIVGIIYLSLCLILGENHPFSLVPMYNKFPNSANVIHFCDGQGKIVPSVKQFHIKSADLAHQYSTICERNNLPPFAEPDSVGQLPNAGKILFDKTLAESPHNGFTGDLQIRRLCYYMQNDSIYSRDIIMYENIISAK